MEDSEDIHPSCSRMLQHQAQNLPGDGCKPTLRCILFCSATSRLQVCNTHRRHRRRGNSRRCFGSCGSVGGHRLQQLHEFLDIDLATTISIHASKELPQLVIRDLICWNLNVLPDRAAEFFKVQQATVVAIIVSEQLDVVPPAESIRRAVELATQPISPAFPNKLDELTNINRLVAILIDRLDHMLHLHLVERYVEQPQSLPQLRCTQRTRFASSPCSHPRIDRFERVDHGCLGREMKVQLC